MAVLTSAQASFMLMPTLMLMLTSLVRTDRALIFDHYDIMAFVCKSDELASRPGEVEILLVASLLQKPG